VDRWEAGSYFEGAAFEQHVLGRPKISRIRMLFIPDFNTTLANMLAGEAHITVDSSMRFEQATVLRRQWEPQHAGTVLVYPEFWRHAYFQHRAEYARPTTLLDARVRKGLLYALDKQALSEALFQGEAILTDSPIPPSSPEFGEVDRVAAKYPFDLRRSEQFMGEAGYSKGPDGVWLHPSAGRFALMFGTFQSPQNENEMHIIADSWRQAGYDITEQVFPSSLASDSQMRNTYPGMQAASATPGEVALTQHVSAILPTAQNRWTGLNRGGWTNAEFDRLADRLNMTLAHDERTTLLVQMARVFTEDAAALSLYFNPTITAFVANLRGPKPASPEGTTAWDIHEWEWTS
jgi:ABC-type transport system substrate-binding protein